MKFHLSLILVLNNVVLRQLVLLALNFWLLRLFRLHLRLLRKHFLWRFLLLLLVLNGQHDIASFMLRDTGGVGEKRWVWLWHWSLLLRLLVLLLVHHLLLLVHWYHLVLILRIEPWLLLDRLRLFSLNNLGIADLLILLLSETLSLQLLCVIFQKHIIFVNSDLNIFQKS